MKKLYTSLMLLLLATASFSQVRVGPFLGYGDGLGLWGLGAYTEIVFNERISVSPIFTQYFPESLANVNRRSAWELNTNLNYYVIRGEVGYLYGLAGLNYTRLRVRTPTVATDQIEIDNNVGLNVGIGTMVRINDLLLPFVEGKYTAGGLSQPSIIFGVKFQFGDNELEDDY